jgi:ribosomal protein S18 acetylase RimI-like enzyme
MMADPVELCRLATTVAPAQAVIDDYARTAAAVLGEDMAASVESLRRVIRSGRIDGWVACQGRQGLGLVVYLERAGGGRLAFFHVVSDCSEEGLAAQLLVHVVAGLRAAGFRHITSQAVLVAHQAAVGQAYAGLGFRAIERMVMSATPAEPPIDLQQAADPAALRQAGYELIGWDDRYMERVAYLFYGANRDTLDALIYPQFRSLDETERLVQAVCDGGAGALVTEASGIVLHRGATCGAIMVVRQKPDEGCVVMVAVAPAHQGRGLGRALLARALSSAKQVGIRLVELTVTEENEPAVALYRRLGFALRRRVTAYVWEAT